MTTPTKASDGADGAKDGDRRAMEKEKGRPDTRLDVDTESLFARAMMQRSDSPVRMGTRTTTSSSSSSTSTLGPKRRSWWDRVVAFGKRRREEDDDLSVDQDLYMRTILESYSSSLSSNRLSSVYYKDHRSSIGGGMPMRSMSRRAFTDESGGVYVAQPETPNADEEAMARAHGLPFDMGRGSEDEEAIMEDEDEKTKRRIQRRITQEAIRAKLLQRNQHRARTRRKFTIFALCIGLTLTAFIGAAMLIANSGTKTREARVQDFLRNQTRSSNSTTPGGGSQTPTPSASMYTPSVPTPGIVSVGDGSGPGSVVLPGVDSGSGSSATSPPGRVNGTLPPLTGRSGLDLITPKPTHPNSPESLPPGPPEGFTKAKSTSYTVFIYVHCLLMSVSLWMSLVVIGMHMTFRSFRTYSMPLVLELSIVQTGYWITSLLRVQFMNPHMNEELSIAFCLAECFFNFGQISFTCALAFNMYRSVVSYADVLMDTQSAKRRYRSYTLNVMMLSLLASVTLALVGYRTRDDNDVDNMEICLYPTCRLILYVYYPLLAFGFNFIFYMRFKRTIGGAYPMSATGRLNKIARSYLVLFFVCWGCLILLTALGDLHVLPKTAKYVLQCVFDVLGVGTALITLTNFVRCRRAFDFGLSLKAIDPHSIEFEEPLQILGEGTFALVLKAKWHQRSLESSDSRTVDVAVKTFKHTQFETLEEMKEEAYLSSKLVHPCVMMTYGCYTIGNNLYIVSEYLGGGTLQDVIDTTDSMPYERVLRYAHMVAMGMRFLHGLPVPIIHRDLKPLNCIFDSDQEMLKIADFGESRLFRKEGGVVRQKTSFFPSFDLTLQMTTNIGSACWAAPEVLKDEGKSEYSLKVDVYSFGIMCWQLYTCKAPYTDIPGSVLAVAEAVMAGRRPDIPGDCPTLFSKIMRRCWHEDPVRRPNFEDIVQLLEIEMSDLQNPKTPPPTDESGRPLHKARSTRRLQLSTPRPGP